MLRWNSTNPVKQPRGVPMGVRAGLTGGHLCIDLTNIEMSGDDQQELLRAVQATVVAQLARQSAMSRVVTISMSPNNGQEDQPEPDRSPDPNRTPRPEPSPRPEP